jgi:hypothetical protein
MHWAFFIANKIQRLDYKKSTVIMAVHILRVIEEWTLKTKFQTNSWSTLHHRGKKTRKKSTLIRSRIICENRMSRDVKEVKMWNKCVHCKPNERPHFWNTWNSCRVSERKNSLMTSCIHTSRTHIWQQRKWVTVDEKKKSK